MLTENHKDITVPYMTNIAKYIKLFMKAKLSTTVITLITVSTQLSHSFLLCLTGMVFQETILNPIRNP